MAKNGPQEFVASLERGLRVLQSFSREHAQMTLSEVAALTGLSAATVRRSLHTLEGLGYIGRSGRRFLLRPKVLTLTSGYLSAINAEVVLQPFVQEVVNEVGGSSSVTVLDDRATFANPVRLPEAHAIRVGDPRATLAEMAPRRDRYVVLVTRGHRLDAECLEIALGMDLVYLGMIGSRRRVGRIREWLQGRGAPRERVERVHAPIGLAIGAETPAEIAVSILAEMIAARRR